MPFGDGVTLLPVSPGLRLVLLCVCVCARVHVCVHMRVRAHGCWGMGQEGRLVCQVLFVLPRYCRTSAPLESSAVG